MFDPTQQFDYLTECGIKEPIKFGVDVDNETDWSRWHCLYPHYINAKKTIAEGRRIAKEKAVDDPTADEMGQICGYFKLPYVIEFNKRYPRDWMIPGRVRVLLKDENEAILTSEIQNKKQLMLKMGELIPKLKSRCTPSSSRQTGASSSTKKEKKRR